MYHRSVDETLDRQMFRHIDDPQKLFASWQQEGCNELFGARFRVPENLLDGVE